jgi:hypothetical protein
MSGKEKAHERAFRISVTENYVHLSRAIDMRHEIHFLDALVLNGAWQGRFPFLFYSVLGRLIGHDVRLNSDAAPSLSRWRSAGGQHNSN